MVRCGAECRDPRASHPGRFERARRFSRAFWLDQPNGIEPLDETADLFRELFLEGFSGDLLEVMQGLFDRGGSGLQELQDGAGKAVQKVRIAGGGVKDHEAGAPLTPLQGVGGWDRPASCLNRLILLVVCVGGER